MIALKYLQSRAMSLEIQIARHYDVDGELCTVYEAIKELEELKNKKCESCSFIDTAPTDEPCANCRFLHIEE